MSDQEILQQAAGVVRQNYPELTAEAITIFIVVADSGIPTLEDISASMGLSDALVFKHVAPLRDAGLVVLQPAQDGSSKVLLTGRGEEAKQAIDQLFAT